jgi:copper chaperone NosL
MQGISMNNDCQRYGMRMHAAGLNPEGILSSLRKSTVSLGVLLACMLIGLCSCQSTAELKPLDIKPNDTCHFCKLAIEQVQYAAEFITKDGFTRKFDDIDCMVKSAQKVKKTNVAAFYVMDYANKQWVKGEEASFVKSERIQTPMNSGIIAFKEKSTADSVASQYGGTVISLNDLIK